RGFPAPPSPARRIHRAVRPGSTAGRMPAATVAVYGCTTPPSPLFCRCLSFSFGGRMAACHLRRTVAGRVLKTWAMKNAERFLVEHQPLTRRHFIRLGVASAAGLGFWRLATGADLFAPGLAKAIETLEPYFTP